MVKAANFTASQVSQGPYSVMSYANGGSALESYHKNQTANEYGIDMNGVQ